MADTIWNGDGTKPWPTSGGGPAGTGTGYVRKTITAISNTGPQQVTATAHGFLTGDTVEQEGTSAIADGLYQITKVDANNYLLNGTTAGGTGTTGYAIDYEVQPAFRMPASGTLADINDVIALGEGITSAIPFLYRRAGKYRLYDLYQYLLPASTGGGVPASAAWSTTSVPNVTLPTYLASTVVSLQTMGGGGLGPYAVPPIVAPGDILKATIRGSVLVGSDSLPDVGQLALGIQFIGTSTNVGTFSGNQLFGATDQPVVSGFDVCCWMPGGGAGPAPLPGTISIALAYYVARNSGGTMSLNLWGPLTYNIEHYRLN